MLVSMFSPAKPVGGPADTCGRFVLNIVHQLKNSTVPLLPLFFVVNFFSCATRNVFN